MSRRHSRSEEGESLGGVCEMSFYSEQVGICKTSSCLPMQNIQIEQSDTDWLIGNSELNSLSHKHEH